MTDLSGKTCAVLQPGYLPWLGFFEQMFRADEFVFLDDVQFDKHGWRNRNRIKGPQGSQWLTVPVRISRLGKPAINQVVIDPTRGKWSKKHLQALRTSYGPCEFFDWLYSDLEALLAKEWTHIADLDIALIELLCAKMSLQRSVRRSSTLGVAGDRCDRLIAICKTLDCDIYYSGQAARSYLEVKAFADAGIKVVLQDYQHPVYPQRFGRFESHLSVLDLLFNCGPGSLSIITEGQAVGVAVKTAS